MIAIKKPIRQMIKYLLAWYTTNSMVEAPNTFLIATVFNSLFIVILQRL